MPENVLWTYKLTGNFQAIINGLLRNMIETGDVVAFISDVIVGTETGERHNNIVEEVLRRMAENNLFVKPEKYVQKVKEVEFLEVVIESNMVKIKKEKVQKIVDQLVLRSVKNVWKFLGLTNYYKQFVKNLTRIAKPLSKITRKDVKQNQGKRQQKAFKELKERLMTELVLIIPDLNKKIRVEADVLDFATGEVLLMKYEDEK